jgi:hypothetical protein
MGIFDTLFGRQKPVPAAKEERLFAISTADVTLQVEEQLKPARNAAICFSGITSGPFQQIQQELQDLLKVSSDTTVQARPYEDPQGYKWIIFESDDFQNLVTFTHMVSQTLISEGYGDRLLAAVFRFNETDGAPVYFIYNFKRATFYPFVPRPDSHSHQRNNGIEFRMGTVLKNDLPIESQLEYWYALWDLPF